MNMCAYVADPQCLAHKTKHTHHCSSFRHSSHWLMKVIITCCAVSRAQAIAGPFFVRAVLDCTLGTHEKWQRSTTPSFSIQSLVAQENSGSQWKMYFDISSIFSSDLTICAQMLMNNIKIWNL